MTHIYVFLLMLFVPSLEFAMDVPSMDHAVLSEWIPTSDRSWTDPRWDEVRTLALLHAERTAHNNATRQALPAPSARTYFALLPRELTDLIIKNYIRTNVRNGKEYVTFLDKWTEVRSWESLLGCIIHYISGQPNQNHYIVDYVDNHLKHEYDYKFAHAIFMGDIKTVEKQLQIYKSCGAVGRLLYTSFWSRKDPYGNCPYIDSCYCEDEGKALDLATRCGHEAIVRLLLEERANLDPQLRSPTGLKIPLISAAMVGRASLLRLLLSQDASDYPWSEGGEFVWNAALRKGDYDCLKLLLEEYFGNSPEERRREACTSVLYTAAERGRLSLLHLSVERGADVNKSYSYEDKPKGGAISCDKKVSNWIYLTALDKAIRACHKDCAAFLLSKGGTIANQDTPREGLLNAASKGDADFIQFLQEHREQLAVPDVEKCKKIVLEHAGKNGYRDLVEPILQQ